MILTEFWGDVFARHWVLIPFQTGHDSDRREQKLQTDAIGLNPFSNRA
ncbi:hypothetical protein [Ignatzschineria ureiclastica]